MDQFYRPRSILVAAFLFLVSHCFAAAYFPPPDSAGGWRTAANAAQIRDVAQMDLPRLEQAWEFTQRCTQNAGLVVVRNGWLVFEKYVGRASRNANPDMASTGKAYTSIACGIMVQEFRDKIPDGLDTKVFTPKFLPEAFNAEGKLDDSRRADITLPVWKNHPDWILLNQHGEKFVNPAGGIWHGALDSGFRDYWRDHIADIVRRFRFDGLWLDTHLSYAQQSRPPDHSARLATIYRGFINAGARQLLVEGDASAFGSYAIAIGDDWERNGARCRSRTFTTAQCCLRVR